MRVTAGVRRGSAGVRPFDPSDPGLTPLPPIERRLTRAPAIANLSEGPTLRGIRHEPPPAILILLLISPVSAQVTYDRLLRADREPHNWLTYSGGYAGHRYSPLSQINRTNVKNLQLKWSYHPLYAKNTNSQNKMENTPLVVDGVIYAGTALEAVALDAVTGRQYWKVSRPLDPKAYYNAYEVNKGMAIAGDTLFWATVDCHLLAIDVKTGRIIWDKLLADYRKGYQYNVAPLVVKTRSFSDRPRTKRAPIAGWRRTTSKQATSSGGSTPPPTLRMRPRRRHGWAIPGNTAAVRSGTPGVTIPKRT